MRPISFTVWTVVAAAALAVSCATQQGAEGQACYANGTCNAGLSCLSKLCVNAGNDAGNSGGDAGNGGTDSGTLDAGGTADAGGTTDAGIDGGVDSGTSDAGAADAGTDAGCPLPSKLFPPPANQPTLFCPFAGVGGGAVYCDSTAQHCCESLTQGSACTPSATACPDGGSVDWQCADPVADCPSGAPVCCAPGATLVLGGTGCANSATSFTHTTCVSAGTCIGNGIQMCTSDGECPSGMTCVPFRKAGNPVGGCQ